MTATNFRDLLATAEHFKTSDGVLSIRVRSAADILSCQVPWVDCPTCKGHGHVGCPGRGEPRTQMERDALGLRKGIDYYYGMHMGHSCSACTGTGHPTVAQLLAWGQAVAQTDPMDYEVVDDYRNRILDTQP